MKRCPECRRDYYDDSLLYCLDDGRALLDGPASGETRLMNTDEPATAIFGDGLQAESAESLASPATNQAVKPQGNVRGRTRSLIALAVVVFVLVAGFAGYRYLPSGTKQISSIAVMPFVNESGNPDNEYLSDGMTETLIRSLSQLPNLNVKARSSVFRYKGTQTDAGTIGRELGVQAILTGRVVQRGDQLNLNLELIDAQTENVIWTDQYDRKQSDLVTLQNEIARDVSSKLKIKLSGDDQQKLAKNYTVDPEAYRLYLQGRFYWNKRTAEQVRKAVGFFQQAIEKDPNFALGYVGLADSFEDIDRPQKKEYIRRALDIDDGLAEAHASLGYQLMIDRDWAGSERELKRSAELNPNYPQAYAWNGMRLTMIGKYDEGLAEIQRALAIDPTANGINFYKGVNLAVSGKWDEAIQQFKKMQEVDPTFPWSHSFLSRIYTWQGDRSAAVEERARSVELDGNSEGAKLLRNSFAAGGWEAFTRESTRQATGGLTSLASLGAVADADKEAALTKLAERAEQGDFWLFLIKVDPLFDPLRADPRFQALLKQFEPPQ